MWQRKTEEECKVSTSPLSLPRNELLAYTHAEYVNASKCPQASLRRPRDTERVKNLRRADLEQRGHTMQAMTGATSCPGGSHTNSSSETSGNTEST